MPRIRDEKTRIWSAGYLTTKDLVANLRALIQGHLEPYLSQIGPSPSILDVGCGHSPYKGLLSRRKMVGINIDAIDASPDVVADGQRLPFGNSAFDAAVCTQVIEHVQEPARMLAEISRCLKPRGLLLLSGPMYWPLHEEPFDFWRFTPHGMRYLLRQTGFEVVEMRMEGKAISLATQSINHLFRGFYFAPLRIGLNIVGGLLDKLIPISHSTTNLSLVARRLPGD